MSIEEIVKWVISLLTYHTTESTSSSKSQPSSPSLKEENGYYIWEKGQVLKLSEHFSTKEMNCHCEYPECKEQRISKDLIEKLEEVREEAAEPLIVTSAYRCSEYQEYLREEAKKPGGKLTVVAKKSTHELGDAVDVCPKSRPVEFGFEDMCAKHFDSIGLAKNFLHLDLRKGKRRWNY